MALVNYYVDPAAGSDTTGDGTSGTPWATVQKALNTITQGAYGDQINVIGGASDSLGSSLSFATYGAPTEFKPLVIRGCTATAGDGGFGEIDGGASVAIVDDVTVDYVVFADMVLGDCGAAHILSMDNNVSLIRCELYGSSNAAPIDMDLDFIMKGCWVHTITGTNAVTCSNNARITGCHIDARDGSMSNGVLNLGGNDFFLQGNVIRCNHASARGLEFSATDATFQSNTFYNAAAGTEAAIWSSSGVVATGCVVQDNIIDGWSGSGGVPIKLLSSSSEGFLMEISNIYVNCASNAPSWAGQPPLFSEGNQDLGTTSPLADPANGDFSVSAAAKEAAFGQALLGLPDTDNAVDAGAAQRKEPAGGGGAASVVGYAG